MNRSEHLKKKNSEQTRAQIDGSVVVVVEPQTTLLNLLFELVRSLSSARDFLRTPAIHNVSISRTSGRNAARRKREERKRFDDGGSLRFEAGGGGEKV